MRKPYPSQWARLPRVQIYQRHLRRITTTSRAGVHGDCANSRVQKAPNALHGTTFDREIAYKVLALINDLAT
jgi:hypothetical protein